MATADETTVGGSVFITVSCGGAIGGDRCPAKGPRCGWFGLFFSSLGRGQGVSLGQKTGPKSRRFLSFPFFSSFFCEHTQTYFYNFILKYLFGWFWVALWIFPVFCSLFQRIKNEHGNKKKRGKDQENPNRGAFGCEKKKKQQTFPPRQNLSIFASAREPCKSPHPKKVNTFPLSTVSRNNFWKCFETSKVKFFPLSNCSSI